MIQKGETVLTEKPFAFVLNTSLKTERCDYCFAAKTLKKCSRCQYVFYCSRNCQKSSWVLHRLECSNLKKISPRTLPETAHLLIRIMLKLQLTEEQGYSPADGNNRTFKDLISHVSEVQNDKRRMEHVTSLTMVLRSFFGKHEPPHDITVLELFSKVCINSFNILDNDMNSIGTAVYLNASRIDHSCKPSAVAVFEGTTLYIRCIENLPNFDWNLIRISYIDILNTTSQRRQELEDLYYFFCDCSRCYNSEEDEAMNSMECPNSDCSGYIPVTENAKKYICSSCQSEADAEKIQQYNEIVQLSDSMKSKDMAYLDVCKMTLSKQERILHNFNVYKIKTLDLAFEACINLQRWDDALKFGTELLPGFRKYYGLYHPLVALVFVKLLKLLLLKEDARKAKSLYIQAEEILSITHGTSHSLYSTLQELFINSIN